MVPRHVDQKRGHQHRARPGTQADADGAQVALLEQFGTAAQLGRLEHHAPGAHRHGLAQRRELAALADAVDQARAQVVLQGLDAAAQGRLREVLLLGGAAERAGVGQGQQVFQLSEVHGFSVLNE